MNERPAQPGSSASPPSASASSASSSAAYPAGSTLATPSPIASLNDSGVSVPQPDTRSSLVLLRASRAAAVADADAFEWLTSRGFDPDLPRKPIAFGWCPMHQAVEEGRLSMCEWLLRQGAGLDVRRADDAGLTPLQLAAMRQDLAVVRWLYTHGAAEVYKYDPHT